MRKLAILAALVLVVAMVGSAYAEVQNVKVGGDIRTAVRSRLNYDLDDANSDPTTQNGVQSDGDHWVETRARIYVQADLTDNVRAMIRLISDIVWSIDVSSENTDGTRNGNAGPGNSWTNGGGDGLAVELDLAWVELSEFWFSYLTAIIGRQELHYGNEFIIGDNCGNASDVDSDELDRKLAFNATRYILDFDPLTIDFVLAIIEEERRLPALANEDETLIGINANYVFSNDWIGELYLWVKDQNNIDVAGAQEVNELTTRLGDDALATEHLDRTIYTIGARAEGALYPLSENLYVNGEIAYQFGDYNDNTAFSVGTSPTYLNDTQDALAAQVSVDYTWDNPYQPNVGAQYSYYEGHEFNDTTGERTAWDHIHEHQTQGIIYDNIAGGPNMGANSNGHIVNAFFSFMPTETVTIAIDYYHFWLDEPLSDSTVRFYQTDTGLYYGYTNSEDAGDEVDGVVIYDYTEDVQFQVRGAVFFPGDAYASGGVNNNDDEAYYAEYSVNVAF